MGIDLGLIDHKYTDSKGRPPKGGRPLAGKAFVDILCLPKGLIRYTIKSNTDRNKQTAKFYRKSAVLFYK